MKTFAPNMDRLFDILDKRGESEDSQIVSVGKRRGRWITMDLKAYRKAADGISMGLLSLGIRKGDRIASITNNRPEWNPVDMGIMQTGAIHVSVSPSSNIDDIKGILRHSEARVVFVSNDVLFNIVRQFKQDTPTIERVFILDDDNDSSSYRSLIALGQETDEKEKFLKIKDSIDGDDVSSIYYSSGTAGSPKGSMITHRSALECVRVLTECYKGIRKGNVLSFIPLATNYERVHNYFYQLNGFPIYYCNPGLSIVDKIKEHGIVTFATVPFIIEQMIKEAGEKKAGQLFAEHLEMIVSSAASLPAALYAFFRKYGIPLVEAYGSCECQLITVNADWCEHSDSTVGVPAENVKVKLGPGNEVLVKSPQVTVGYFRDTEKNSILFDKDGWVRTGDIGEMVEGRFLRVVGRKDARFKASNGIFISPETIEDVLLESPFIADAIVTKNSNGNIVAILHPDFSQVRSTMSLQDAENDKSFSELIYSPSVREEFRNAIVAYNSIALPSQRISHHAIAHHQWSVAGGELTSSLKLKRDVIISKFTDRLI